MSILCNSDLFVNIISDTETTKKMSRKFYTHD